MWGGVPSGSNHTVLLEALHNPTVGSLGWRTANGHHSHELSNFRALRGLRGRHGGHWRVGQRYLGRALALDLLQPSAVAGAGRLEALRFGLDFDYWPLHRDKFRFNAI